jgi:hypothetical protein
MGVGELKRRAAAAQLKLDESGHEASAVIATVRQKLERERAGIEPTRAFASQTKNPPADSS